MATPVLDYYKKKQIDEKLNAKQDALSFDATPKDDSDNVVRSKGIKSYVDSVVTGISQFKYEIVASLPTASSSTVGKIYLVKDEHATNDNYDEYITIESDGSYSWEKIGNTDIDLSGYVTTDTVQTISAFKTFNANLRITAGGAITARELAFPSIHFNGDNITLQSSLNNNMKINADDGKISFAYDGITWNFPDKADYSYFGSNSAVEFAPMGLVPLSIGYDDATKKISFKDGNGSELFGIYANTVNGNALFSETGTSNISTLKSYKHSYYCELTVSATEYMRFFVEDVRGSNSLYTTLEQLTNRLAELRSNGDGSNVPIKGFYYLNGDVFELSHIGLMNYIYISPTHTTSSTFIQSDYQIASITAFQDKLWIL